MHGLWFFVYCAQNWPTPLRIWSAVQCIWPLFVHLVKHCTFSQLITRTVHLVNFAAHLTKCAVWSNVPYVSTLVQAFISTPLDYCNPVLYGIVDNKCCSNFPMPTSHSECFGLSGDWIHCQFAAADRRQLWSLTVNTCSVFRTNSCHDSCSFAAASPRPVTVCQYICDSRIAQFDGH